MEVWIVECIVCSEKCGYRADFVIIVKTIIVINHDVVMFYCNRLVESRVRVGGGRRG